MGLSWISRSKYDDWKDWKWPRQLPKKINRYLKDSISIIHITDSLTHCIKISLLLRRWEAKSLSDIFPKPQLSISIWISDRIIYSKVESLLICKSLQFSPLLVCQSTILIYQIFNSSDWWSKESSWKRSVSPAFPPDFSSPWESWSLSQSEPFINNRTNHSCSVNSMGSDWFFKIGIFPGIEFMSKSS